MRRCLRSLFSLLACALFGGVVTTAHAQDINFKDLARSGPPVVKRYTVTGVDADGRAYVQKFEGVDTSRVAALNASRGSGSSSSSSGSGGGDRFACTVTCTGSWWASGANVSVVVSARNEDDAKDQAAREANPHCRRQKNAKGVFENTSLSSGSAKCERK